MALQLPGSQAASLSARRGASPQRPRTGRERMKREEHTMKTTAIAFLAACTVACGGAGATSNTGTAAQPRDQVASKDPSATGVPECDEWIRLVTRCIET